MNKAILQTKPASKSIKIKSDMIDRHLFLFEENIFPRFSEYLNFPPGVVLAA